MREMSSQQMKSNCIGLALALSAALTAPVHAAVVTDGSLGAATSLTGPNYAINSTLGQTRSSNLFHSFSRFNLSTGESATFSGPATITNIISRVTGGDSSSINGTLGSSIAGANIYLMNPAGIVFGPDASLNITGSFHATTADYIKLGSAGRFEAAITGGSNLTIDPPGAFGFLSQHPAAIDLNGSLLTVPEGKSISLTAGGITTTNANLWAFGGDVSLVSVASPGEVLFAGNGTVLQGFSALGPITIIENRGNALQPVYGLPGIPIDMQGLRTANLDASGNGGGKIVIRGGTFYLSGGTIYNDTYGSTAPGSAVIVMNGTVTITGGSAVTSNAMTGTTASAPISISGAAVQVTDSKINTDSFNGADGANLSLMATDKLTINGTSIVSTDADSKDSHAGALTLTAPDVAVLDSGIVSSSAPVNEAGGAGSIKIDASRSLTVTGQLRSDTFDGTSGAISIVTGDLNINNSGLISTQLTKNTLLSSRTAGDINITARNVAISGNGSIQSNVTNSKSGNGGNITINADSLTLSGGSVQSDVKTTEPNINDTSGNGGNIFINSKNLNMTNGSAISTGNDSDSGSGGNILVNNSWIMSAQNSEVTTSATKNSGSGNGGNVTLNSGYLALNDGKITAQAAFGSGGNLLLTLSNMFVKSAFSLLSASSRFGADGTVIVNAPYTDISGALAVPRLDFINMNAFAPRRCQAADESTASTFRLLGNEGLPPTPEMSFPALLPR